MNGFNYFFTVLFFTIPFFFQAQTTFKVPANPYETCIVDYDLDGDNDIVVGCSGLNQDPDSIIIFINDSWGNFEIEKFEFQNQIELYCADLTGDSYPDLITQTVDNMVFYENNGSNGIFITEHFIMNLDCSPKSGGITDINNDSKNDIIYFCRYAPYSWGLQINNSDFTFTETTIVTNSNQTLRTTTGDLDMDGRSDILVTTLEPTKEVSIFYNNYPNFVQNEIASPDWHHGFILNANGDNSNDILLFTSTYFGPSKLVNMINKDENFQSCDTLVYAHGSKVSNINDYNFDGYDDLAMIIYQANNQPIEDSVYIYFNDQHCRYTHIQSIYIGDYNWLPTINSGDLNGDGYPELVIQGYSMPTPDYIRILWNDGTGNFIDTNSVYVQQNEILYKHQIKIFPNPASDNLSITSTSEKIKEVKILDLNGRIFLQEEFSPNQVKVDLNLRSTQLGSGLYICCIQLENELYIFKTFILNKIL